MKIYVASPLGFAESGRFFLYEKLIPSLESAGAEIIDPWKLTPQLLIEDAASIDGQTERKAALRQLNAVIGKNNADGIERADCVIAVLDGADVDSGTAAEIGFAFAKNKLIIGYRNDFRLSADNEGSIVNLQVEYFITASGGKIVNSLNDLTVLLRQFSAQR